MNEVLDGEAVAASIFVATDDADTAAGCRDDTGGDRRLQAKRITNRDHPFANADVGALGKMDGRESRALDLQDGQIRQWVTTNQLGLVLLLLRRHHRDAAFLGVLHNVVVRHDIAVRCHDHARPCPLTLIRNTGLHILFHSVRTKETEEILRHAAATGRALGLGLYTDADHGVGDGIGNGNKLIIERFDGCRCG